MNAEQMLWSIFGLSSIFAVFVFAVDRKTGQCFGAQVFYFMVRIALAMSSSCQTLSEELRDGLSKTAASAIHSWRYSDPQKGEFQ